MLFFFSKDNGFASSFFSFLVNQFFRCCRSIHAPELTPVVVYSIVEMCPQMTLTERSRHWKGQSLFVSSLGLRPGSKYVLLFTISLIYDYAYIFPSFFSFAYNFPFWNKIIREDGNISKWCSKIARFPCWYISNTVEKSGGTLNRRADNISFSLLERVQLFSLTLWK